MDSRLRSTARGTLGAFLVLVLAIVSASSAEARIFGRRFSSYVPAVSRPQPVVSPEPRRDRVSDLPEDGDQWDLVVVTDGSASGEQLVRAFKESPRLADFSSQVKSHFYPANFWWVTWYFGQDIKPMVIVQDQHGQLVYKVQGDNMPATADELADEIQSSVWAYQPGAGGECPDCDKPADDQAGIFNQPAKKLADVRPPPGDNEWMVGAGIAAAAVLFAWLFRTKAQ